MTTSGAEFAAILTGIFEDRDRVPFDLWAQAVIGTLDRHPVARLKTTILAPNGVGDPSPLSISDYWYFCLHMMIAAWALPWCLAQSRGR